MRSSLRGVLGGAFLGLCLAGCSSLGAWLDEPTTAPPGTVEAGGGVVVTTPPPADGSVSLDLPDGAGTVTAALPPSQPTTRGESLVSAVSGVLGTVNPMLGFAAAAGGKLLLGAFQRRRGAPA